MLKVEVVAKHGPAWVSKFSRDSVRIIHKHLLASKLSARRRRQLSEAKFLTIAYVTPLEIGKLNADFRGKNRPTDVLSFAPVEPGSLGELVITMPLIREQAKENAHSVQSELTYILLHGILHLLGLDHGSPMFSVQDAIFDELRETWLVPKGLGR